MKQTRTQRLLERAANRAARKAKSAKRGSIMFRRFECRIARHKAMGIDLLAVRANAA